MEKGIRWQEEADVNVPKNPKEITKSGVIFGTEEERERVYELAENAKKIVQEMFPEVILRSWSFFYEVKDGQTLPPGAELEVTGPEKAVEAFLLTLIRIESTISP